MSSNVDPANPTYGWDDVTGEWVKNYTDPNLQSSTTYWNDVVSNADPSSFTWNDVRKLFTGTSPFGAPGQIAALAGIGGLTGMFKSSKPPGYRGGIPQLTATRTQLAQPTPAAGAPARRPGSAGRRYFSDVTYAPVTTATTGGGGGGGGGGGADTVAGGDGSDSVNIATDGGGMAQGGIAEMARGGKAMPPRYLRGQTDGMADRIPSSIDNRQPAKLSHGEFVIPADVVSHLGNGNSDAGAKVLYQMMDRVRRARTGTKKQGRRINPARFTPGGIAGYAGGGAVAFDAGGVAGDVSTESNLSSWIGPYVTDYMGKGQALANTPYQAYTGPLTAGESGLQSKVFSGLQGLSFPGQLGQTFSSTGAYQLPTAGGPATGPGGIASQYMNPYLSAVLTPQLEEMRRQSEISRKNLGAKFSGIGGGASAFGGGRQAIESAELERNLMQEQNKAIGTGYANAYDRAMGQFNTEQGQAKTLADMMAGAGKTQRDIEGEGIAADRAQFEEERLHPYKQLQFQQSLIQGLPASTSTTSEATTGLGQLSGTLGGLMGLADQIKKLFPNG